LGKLIPDDIRKKVLTEITPTKEEVRVQKETIDSLRDALVHHAEENGIQYSFIEPQGSTGRKQTQLRNAADIDLFVGLDPAEHTDILEGSQKERTINIDNLMTKLVDEWFTPAIADMAVSQAKTAYSQHPYLSLQIENLEVDILGCFDIDSTTLSKNGPYTAVDRTVHHTKYVADNLTEKTREDTRILKSFVRACHAYGDRCAVGRMGLTGVSLELIAIGSNDLDLALESLELLDERPIDPNGRSLEELRKIRELLEPKPSAPPPPPKNFLDEFRQFLTKYKVMGLAVAFILAIHLGALVQALVNDLIMPLIELGLPDVPWEEIVFGPFMVGHFIGQFVTFLIVAFVIFLLVKVTSRYGIE